MIQVRPASLETEAPPVPLALDLQALLGRKVFQATQEDQALPEHQVSKVNQVQRSQKKVSRDPEDGMANQDSPVHQVRLVSLDNQVSQV